MPLVKANHPPLTPRPPAPVRRSMGATRTGATTAPAFGPAFAGSLPALSIVMGSRTEAFFLVASFLCIERGYLYRRFHLG